MRVSVMSQKSIMDSKRKSSDRRLSCRAAADKQDTMKTLAPYRCVFLTEAQSTSVGMLSRKRRDLLDARHFDQQLSPHICSPARVHTGMDTVIQDIHY